MPQPTAERTTDGRHPNRWSPPLALTWVVTFVAYVGVVKLLAPVAVPPENVSLFWLANAVVVVALLVTERRWWWTLWLVVVPAEITADALQGMGPGVASWWALVNVVEATTVAAVLQRFAGPGALMRSVRSTAVLVAAAIAIPAFAGMLGGLGSVVAFGADWWGAWRNWWFGDAVGLIVGVPVGLALFDLRSSVAAARPRGARMAFGVTILATTGAAVGLAATGHLASAQHVAIAGGIVAGLGLGAPGAAIGVAAAAVVGVLPAVLQASDVSVATTQAFLLVVAAAILFTGGVTESEHSNTRALARSEERFRATFEDAPIGMAITDLGEGPLGRWKQVNLALARTLGRTPGELLAAHPVDLVHPDDLGEDDVAVLTSGAVDRIDTERRYRHANGDYRWCRVVKSVVRDPTSEEPAYAVTQLEDVTAAKDAAAQLEHAALHDALTGLPNRLLLVDRLTQALAELRRGSGVVAVLYVDLDRFKSVNDSLGHDAGDAVLLEVARRLREGVRPADTIARLGGDEFAIVCGDLADEDVVLHLAERLGDTLNGPTVLEGHPVDISGSIGVSVTRKPLHDPRELLRDADAAMFQAKGLGGRRVTLFDEALARLAGRRMQAEGSLREALADERLVLHYQPIVEISSGAVVAVEALVRYEEADGTLVGPDSFLDIAEDTGLIVDIGDWVVHEACRQTARWQQQLQRPPQVSINFSGRQITDPRFAHTVLDAIDSTGADPGLLCLEVTETVLVDAPHSLFQTIDRLKRRGVTVALDDFGTGYSSLTYLKRFPVDRIKIDRSFTAGLLEHDDDRAIVAAVTGLGRSLGLSVVAEGVETEAQCRQLRAVGCDLAQGFLFARPAGAGELASVLE